MPAARRRTLDQSRFQFNQTYGVPVEIEVLEEVSIWRPVAPNANTPIELTMSGFDGNNTASAVSSMAYVNNVAADISVEATGNLDANDEIALFIFDQANTTAALSTAFQGNAYAPGGVGNYARFVTSTFGTPQPLTSVPVNLAGGLLNVTYAVNSPGSLPAIATYPIVVTWTIASATP